MLVRLIYHSLSAVPLGEPGADTTLLRILEHSRRNNTERDITGVLFYGEDGFIQLLEGSKATVNHVFARIMTDPRHYGVTLDEFRAAHFRLFPRWSMGFVPARRELQARLTDAIADPDPSNALKRVVTETGVAETLEHDGDRNPLAERVSTA